MGSREFLWEVSNLWIFMLMVLTHTKMTGARAHLGQGSWYEPAHSTHLGAFKNHFSFYKAKDQILLHGIYMGSMRNLRVGSWSRFYVDCDLGKANFQKHQSV